MSDFTAILFDVEQRSAQRNEPRAAGAGLRARLSGERGPAARNSREAMSAYATHCAPPDADATGCRDAETLRTAIRRAGRDAQLLRSLRRVAARALHPDRGGDGDMLAECNALIDAGLRTSRRRT